MNDAKTHESLIGKVLESYVRPFKRLSANFPSHDVEIQLEFQKPTNQQASEIIQKRPIYRQSRKKPKIHTLHEKVHSGLEYLAERNPYEQYSVPNHNTEYFPHDHAMDNYASRSIVKDFRGHKIIDNFGRHNAIGSHNGIVNLGGRNGMNNLAGYNTAMDNFSSRNAIGNIASYSAVKNLAAPIAIDSFDGRNAMKVDNPGLQQTNHGVGNVMGQETVQAAHMAPAESKGVPPVARQAETESKTTEATVSADSVNKGPTLSLEDIRRLFDEYAEKIISSKSGNERQTSYNDQVPQVYIQDNNGNLDESMVSNLEQVANLIKKGVQVYKVDENNQESFLPKTGLNWMRIKVPVQ